VRWHTMKLPNGIDFLGDLGYCSCQIISIWWDHHDLTHTPFLSSCTQIFQVGRD
jgi:hypothetical protein